MESCKFSLKSLEGRKALLFQDANLLVTEENWEEMSPETAGADPIGVKMQDQMVRSPLTVLVFYLYENMLFVGRGKYNQFCCE